MPLLHIKPQYLCRQKWHKMIQDFIYFVEDTVPVVAGFPKDKG